MFIASATEDKISNVLLDAVKSLIIIVIELKIFFYTSK